MGLRGREVKPSEGHSSEIPDSWVFQLRKECPSEMRTEVQGWGSLQHFGDPRSFQQCRERRHTQRVGAQEPVPKIGMSLGKVPCASLGGTQEGRRNTKSL